jgi:hypothetical protein
VYVFKAQPAMQEGKEPQYSCTFLWDEKDPKLKPLKDAIVKVATEKFGAKAEQMLAKGQLKNPLRPGSERDYEDYQGKVFLTARSSEKPQVVDEQAEPIMDTTSFYAGCIARGDIWLYAFDKAGNKGVAAILNNVQKLGDGERKSGRRSAAEAFGASDE